MEALEVIKVIGRADSNHRRITLREHGANEIYVHGNHGGINVVVVDNNVAILNDIFGHRVTDLEVWDWCWCSEDEGSNNRRQSSELSEIGSHDERDSEDVMVLKIGEFELLGDGGRV